MNPLTRQRRIDELKKIIMQTYFKDDTINYENLIHELMSYWSAKKQTIMEYLEILEQQKFIIVDVLPEIKKEKNYEGKDCIKVISRYKICWANPDSPEVKLLIRRSEGEGDSIYY